MRIAITTLSIIDFLTQEIYKKKNTQSIIDGKMTVFSLSNEKSTQHIIIRDCIAHSYPRSYAYPILVLKCRIRFVADCLPYRICKDFLIETSDLDLRELLICESLLISEGKQISNIYIF